MLPALRFLLLDAPIAIVKPYLMQNQPIPLCAETILRPGATLGDVGAAIDAVGRAQGFSSEPDFCGHGVGQKFHDAPQVMHYGTPGTGVVLEAGMIFTIEPMLNAGTHHVKVLSDKWTTVTKDHALSAQFEHTLAVTATGFEIFTLSAAER